VAHHHEQTTAITRLMMMKMSHPTGWASSCFADDGIAP